MIRSLRLYIVLAAIAWPMAACAAGPKPNVILIMADDLGWGDTGYNGHPHLRTPHLDAMSAAGLRFDRFYAASAVCSPTRGSCLTGRHPSRLGIPTANAGHLHANEVCLAEVLKAHGYTTGHFGKWHLGTMTADYSGKGERRNPKKNHSTPGMNGFDEWFSTEFAVATWDPYDPTNAHTKEFDPRNLYWHNGVNVTEPLTGCDSRIIMDKATAFIEKAAKDNRPFFAVIWFHAPHEPVVGGPGYRAMYSRFSEDQQHYYAVVTALDEQVGRLRKQLKDLGVERHTMVWFASDNGPEGNPHAHGRRRGSAGPYRGRKRSLYEGGVRVPGLLVWPAKITQGRTTRLPAVTSDYFPTVLEAVGATPAPGRPIDGVSLMPLIEGRMTERPQPIGFRFASQAALHDGKYKLVHNTAHKRPRSDNGQAPLTEWELYDLVADPGETTNIAAKHPRRVERMRAQLAEWRASCEADGP